MLRLPTLTRGGSNLELKAGAEVIFLSPLANALFEYVSVLLIVVFGGHTTASYAKLDYVSNGIHTHAVLEEPQILPRL